MKNSTKYKIIGWVEKLLGVNKPFFPIIKTEEKEIHILRYVGKYDLRTPPFEVDHLIIKELVSQLIKTGAIVSKSIKKDNPSEHIEVEARLYYVTPPKEWN